MVDIIFILTGMQVKKLTYPVVELIKKYGIPPYRNKFIVTPPNGTLDSNNSIDILLWMVIMLVATWCCKIPKFYTQTFSPKIPHTNICMGVRHTCEMACT